MEGTHHNRKFCSTKCVDKARYEKYGPRSTSEQRRKWYEGRKKKEGYVQKLRQQTNERNRRVKDFLKVYKLSQGCKDCGYNKHHVALDFDHVRGKKELNVCFSKSIEQAKKEIAKCEVVCSNCHRIRTYMRLKNE